MASSSREFSGVFDLADRRMVAGHLANRARRDQVQARIAHVSDGDLLAFHQRQGQHAGHAGQAPRCSCASAKMRLLAAAMASRTRCRGRHVRCSPADAHRGSRPRRSPPRARPPPGRRRHPPPGRRRAPGPPSSDPRCDRAPGRYRSRLRRSAQSSVTAGLEGELQRFRQRDFGPLRQRDLDIARPGAGRSARFRSG